MERIGLMIGGSGCLIWFCGILLAFAGWINHVVHCIQNEQWILLLVGALAAPIGIIHGLGLWIGVF